MLLTKQISCLQVYYWMCASILWAYMSVTILNAYKSWYITTAAAIVCMVLLSSAGVLNTHGALRSTRIVLVYFFYLLLTAVWADYPETTLLYVAVESIFIAVFLLFFLLSLNASAARMTGFFTSLVPPAVVICFVLYRINPDVSRLGGYVLVVLPFALLFTSVQLLHELSLRNLIYFTASLLILMVGMSRTPLLIAGLGLLSIFIWIVKGWRAWCRLLAGFLTAGLIVGLAFLLLQTVRLNMVKATSRITGQDISIADQIVETEGPDVIRWTIYEDAGSLYRSNWVLGIGYMNFMPWFGEEYGFRTETAGGKETVGMSLHNVYQTWALEGGLPCLAIVFCLLWKYFHILFLKIRQSCDDRENSYYKLLVISMICLLVAGLFHQIHQTPVFFMLLGIVFALDHKAEPCASSSGSC